MSSIAGCFPHNLPFSKFLSFLLFFFSSAVLCELGEAVRQNSDAWQFVDKCGDPGILGQLRAIMVHHIWIDISIRLYLPPSLSLPLYIYYIYTVTWELIILHPFSWGCTPWKTAWVHLVQWPGRDGLCREGTCVETWILPLLWCRTTQRRRWAGLSSKCELPSEHGWRGNPRTKWRFLWIVIEVHKWEIVHCKVWLSEGNNSP